MANKSWVLQLGSQSATLTTDMGHLQVWGHLAVTKEQHDTFLKENQLKA